MCYDEILSYPTVVGDVTAGCIYGNQAVVLIKVGLGGDHHGDGDRYVRIARHLHERHGCSVLCISNPNIEADHAAIDKALLMDFIKKSALAHPRLYFFGNSNGCTKGLSLAASGVPFERMILVNMPLMINFHRIKAQLACIEQTDVTVACGERDPSYPYLPFLEGRLCHVTVKRIAGADHNFVGCVENFISLADGLITAHESKKE